MVQLFVLLFALLLIGLLFRLGQHRRPTVPPLPQVEPVPPSRLLARLQVMSATTQGQRMRRLPRALPLRQLKRLLRQPSELPSLRFLQSSGQELLMALLTLGQRLRQAPRLPGAATGEPRLLGLCQRYLLLGGSTQADNLLAAVDAMQPAASLTLEERRCFPLCLGLALCQQLRTVLAHLGQQLAEYRHGLRLARRLRRAKRPMQLLSSHSLTLTETQALLAQLAAWQEHSLLASIQERLAQEHSSSQQVAEGFASQQTALADHLRRILSDLRHLEHLDWDSLLEPRDPLHALLLQDPTGTYPAMDGPSRLLYRQRTAALARLFHAQEQHLLRQALTLCRQADPDGLRDHVGWYLLEPAGMRALQARLRTHRGWLRLRLGTAAPWLYRLVLVVDLVAGGLHFLNARHPLWMLPIFLGVWSCLTHALLDALLRHVLPPTPLPRMDITHLGESARVLLAMPVTLGDTAQAVPAVRSLLLARKAFPQAGVDCLLLADYAHAPTQTSSQDEAIVSATRIAINAVDGDGGRFLYLQRRRSWCPDQHAYMGQGGASGAQDSLNRLIIHGECADAFDAASLPPSALHRRYAYVLALDAAALPAPHSLLPLLGALTHPLSERRHTAEGVRGFTLLQPAMETNAMAVRSRMGLWAHGSATGHLYRPDALLESTEGWLSAQDAISRPWLEGALSGCQRDAATVFFTTPPNTMADWLSRLHRQTRSDWQLLPWLLPHVQTPSGLRRTPLSTHSRYALRQRLRRSLVPLCSLLLILYAALAHSLPLMLLALIAAVVPLRSPSRFLVHLVELPLTAAVQADAILRALWRRLVSHQHLLDEQPTFATHGLSAWENWSQCLCALGLVAASLAVRPIFLPGLAVALAFACFPLVRPWVDALLPIPTPTRDMEAALVDVAQATWRFFEETVTPATHHLPPESLQLKPYRGAAKTTTPEAMGLYLLACLSMRELGLIDTPTLCQRIAATMDTLHRLPLWHGLPYSRYATDTLAPEQPFIASEGCGVLCACLMALSQGLRSLLPQTPEEYTTLSAQVDAFAAGMELFRLYDPQAQLFATGYDVAQGMLTGELHSLYASPARLLSVVAVMGRHVPLGHLHRLNRTLVRMGVDTPYISQWGTASEYLLPTLLLPDAPHTLMARTLRAIIRAQRRHGKEGMFGLSESGCWALDQQLRYQQRSFGTAETALEVPCTQAVIAPYAAALCLPFAPEKAFDSLMRLRSRGMLSRLGYFDSLDMEPSHLPEHTREAPVQCHVATHQGMLLCALGNLLTGGVLVQHFTAVPAAAALVPLLQQKHPSSLVLPSRLVHPAAPAPKEPPFRRSAAALSAPMDAHIIGSPEAMLLMSAQGLGTMQARGVPLTPFTGDPTQAEGVQFYLEDGAKTYRLTDPSLPGDTIFAEGEMRYLRTCGGVQATLTALTDPVQGAFLHMVELANLSSRERTLSLSSCLVPDLHAQGGLAISQPEERVLTATRAAPHPLTLCHAVSTHEPLLALTTQQGATPPGCLSFHLRLRLGSKGRAAVIFVTRLMQPGEAFSLEALAPRLSDIGNLKNLSRLLSRTMTDSLHLSQTQAAELSHLFGALLWRGQPRQGAVLPLAFSPQRLGELGIDPSLPLLTVMVHSGGCGTLVHQASDAVQWLALLGQQASLCVLCQGSEAVRARDKVWAVLQSRRATVLLCADLPDGARQTVEAASRFILYEGSGSISQQLDAQAQPIAALNPHGDAPAPPLPAEELRFPTPYGGFQPDTGNLVILPENAPSLWRTRLTGQHISCLCLSSGLGATQADWPLTTAECAYLSGDGGTFTPFNDGCRMQLSPGIACWHSLGHGLDMLLTTAILPESTFACRCLRLKNTTQAEQQLTLTIAASFAMGVAAFACLSPADGCVVALAPEVPLQGCLALVEGTCHSRAVSPLAFHGFGALPDLDAPEDEAGTVALLQLHLVIPAGGSQSVPWLLGACHHMEELELLRLQLQETGTSAAFRQVQKLWADRLGQLRLRTPEERMDLMLNRLLPWQMHTLPETAEPDALLQTIPGLVLTAPEHARELLVSCASRYTSEEAGALLPLAASWYMQHTSDTTVLDDLYPHCLHALTSVPLGTHGLPLLPEGESVSLGLLYALALQAFAPYARGEAQATLAQAHTHLTEAIERFGWQGGCYGTPEDIRCQCLAVLALGCTQRTAQAMEHALQRPTGLEPWLLHALCHLGWWEQAWGLLLGTQPMDYLEAATPQQAAWLYALVLEKLLGFEKRGNQARLRPMVPPQWDSFTLTLQWGASTWHFHAQQDVPFLTQDGQRAATGWITLVDDGRIHEVRAPLRRGG